MSAAAAWPRASAAAPLAWVRANLFGSVPSTLATLAAVYLAWLALPAFFGWAFARAVWLPSHARLCREAAGAGACWAFVAEKWRFIFFGTYPAEEQWRPALAIVLLLALYGASARRGMWRPRLVLLWLGGLTLLGILMWGGVFGLRYVENERWGGLALTLLLSTFGIGFAFPLSVLLALGRRSPLPVLRYLCIGYIECVRAVPLISVLFMASVLLPLFLPADVTLDKLLRAQLAMICFAAAYLAEVVRGGLQAVPPGQEEAARALGLSYWQRHARVLLPQALRIAVPPLVNTFIGFFKDTSLVVIIGLYDLLTTIRVSLNEPAWSGFSVEAYLFAALVYFVFCYPMSRYSRRLERGGGAAPATIA